MKKVLFIGACVIMITLTQCGAPKNLANVNAQQEVEVAIPLSGPEYWSDATYYRAVQEGVSPSSSMAKKVALQNARQELVSSISSDIKAVIQNYGSNRNFGASEGEKAEMNAKYEELFENLVANQVADVRIIGEKMFKLPTNNYRCHVAIQMEKAAIKESIVKAISNDEKLKQDFELSLFEQKLNEKFADYEKKNVK